MAATWAVGGRGCARTAHSKQAHAKQAFHARLITARRRQVAMAFDQYIFPEPYMCDHLPTNVRQLARTPRPRVLAQGKLR